MKSTWFYAAALLLSLAAVGCGRHATHGPEWSKVPYLAGDSEPPSSPAASGIQVSEDNEHLHIRVHGYMPPRQLSNFQMETGGVLRVFDSRVDVWQVVLNNDRFTDRIISFNPGQSGTTCSDPNVRFSEYPRKQILELSLPLAEIVNGPVLVQVNRVMNLFDGGAAPVRAVHTFPDKPIEFHSPNLKLDMQPGRVEDVKIGELKSDSVVLNWASDKRLTSRIEIAAEGDDFREVCDAEPHRRRHEVVLRRLRPDTIYRYRVSGTDFGGTAAEAVTGGFRTAMPSGQSDAMTRRDLPWRSVRMRSEGSMVYTPDGLLRGVRITSTPDAVWKMNRESSAGNYRLSIYMWHAEDAGNVQVQVTRSGEVPMQYRTLLNLPNHRDGKLHHYEAIIDVPTAFDAIILRTSSGRGGPVTSLNLYELPPQYGNELDR